MSIISLMLRRLSMLGKKDELDGIKERTAGWLISNLGRCAAVGGVMVLAGVFCGEAMGYVERIDSITVSGGEFGSTFNGTYDFEGVYLPGVVDCENGAASTEALKAQAVAARTYAYYKLSTSSTIQNGQGAQVFRTPWNTSAGQQHIDAVNATSGEIVAFNDSFICSFYVAGSKPSTLPLSPSDNTAKTFWQTNSTETYVTYNYPDNNWGSNNQGSSLGWLSNPVNRGCMSQNGADFLADKGMNYIDILKYYYGGDIQIESVITKPNSGQSPFASRYLADFESDGTANLASKEGVFGWSPQMSGSNKNIGSGTTATWYDAVTSNVHSGDASQKIVIDYDESNPNGGSGFFLRHIAGAQNIQASTVASKTANSILEGTGTIGVWLKTSSQNTEVSIALDDKASGFGSDLGTGDRGVKQSIVSDGQWHKYEWDLDDASDWQAWVGAGDGQIGERFSLDSIQFWGTADAELYMDDVYYNMAGSSSSLMIPEPTTMLMLIGLGGLMVGKRR
ncbi:PEP-CTERM sorting domain-containing protein [Planctomycetota bacterium]|nr:PEP-CTERM sorting domain-containing protein [Planctomycetota bacterium]